MGKNILVPEELICDVYSLTRYLAGKDIPDEAKRLCKSIIIGIEYKIKKMEAHMAFSAYKMAPPGQEREDLRREYIRVAEIRKSFTSEQELPYSLW